MQNCLCIVENDNFLTEQIITYLGNKRKLLSEIFGESMSQSIKILYGGSMKPENTKDLLSQKDIDGGLIGGASLKASSFCEMISIADKLLL